MITKNKVNNNLNQINEKEEKVFLSKKLCNDFDL